MKNLDHPENLGSDLRNPQRVSGMESTIKQSTWFTVAVSILFAAAATIPTQGAVTITATESGGNVVFSYTGSINLTGMGSPSAATSPSDIDPLAGLFASKGSDSANTSDFYGVTFNTTPFGTGMLAIADSSSGDIFMVAPNQIRVNPSYASNSAINGTMTFNSTNFATLGLTIGSYNWTNTANSDTVTINIVPEPSHFLIAGLSGIGFLLRRHRRPQAV